MKKRLLSFFLAIIMLLGLETTIYANVIEEDMDDPEYWSAQGYIDDAFYGDSFERAASIPGRGNYTLRKGIDVSKWQGDIDWKKAKEAGVEFAIIRVGYRGYSGGKLGVDNKYVQNIEGALANDIRVGVYIYSQAITVEEAVEEAQFVLSRIYKYNISLPIVIDYEYYSGKDGESGRLYDANLSKETATEICSAFCDTVEAAGYTGMVYANKYMFTNKLDGDKLAEDYRIWLAHYTSATNYKGTYDFWQYSSTGDGYAHGMESQNLDMNWWYDDGKIYGKDYGPIFDAEYYANRYEDLRNAFGNDTVALLTHFVNNGMREGRQGNEDFNVISYKNRYPDLRKVLGDSLESYYNHYLEYGEKEGRVATGCEGYIVGANTVYEGVDYAAVYDFNEYIKNNQDVYRVHGMDENAVLSHFVIFGMKEGRLASSNFNVISYKERYGDLQQVYGDDLQSYYMHYINYGQYEGRVARSVDPYYAPVFDAEYYLNEYVDLKNAFGDNEIAAFDHFMVFGMKEGRQACESFNAQVYRANNRDLQKAFGDNMQSYYEHYLRFGIHEGREGK